MALLTFKVDRDEPFGENLIWMNWGVFDSVEEESTSKVYGKTDPFPYNIPLRWSDYYDRPLITYLYIVICSSSLLGIFSPPISILPIMLLQIYVFVVPYGVFLLQDFSK